ncbi:hypothetical protein COCCADRAFT_96923 [Bipolaris zeicola 26-R-13]|uniref:Uncharacterized protein n=1 Tax=Cochliobolus carbonum (strain 26-R-13) TaxID=930089 RepID=W6Y600_COCC2|nr:uncharacterized protein COCCADRAFT_96923 [Bipolaris zeicola 26-R-13]EUC33115.1 hypothetical protein COCCADRAFT_96923 [Bipolaris zeicola 26-R-13]
MNWTGGSLQRTKKANSGMLQRQRAYFAKARTNLQNIPQTPVAPFIPSYLRDNSKSDYLAVPSFELISDRHLSGPKRKAPDKNVEMQLLEANKKRLLTRADWIGIDASKPVQLQFVSCKQKEKIGKRRRTSGKCRAQRRQCVEGELKPKKPHLQHRSFAKLLESRANQDGPENIHIRIGTEALTDEESDQLEECAQSEACSSPMLFKQDDLVSHVAATCEDARHHGDASSCAESRNLRFVFRGRASPMGLRTHHVTGRQKMDETQLLEERASASTCQAKHVHRVTNDSEDPSAYAIVDQEPWMAYLAISDVSSRENDTGVCTKDELQLDESIAGNESGCDTRWSKGATQGLEEEDGESFGVASKCECLASLGRGIVGRAATGYVPEMKGIRADQPNWSHVQTLGEDEKEWQAFVLGSDQSQSLPRVQLNARRRFAQTVVEYAQEACSEQLPLSIAASCASTPARNEAEIP